MPDIKIFISAFLFLFQLQSVAQEFNPPFFVFEDGLWNAKPESPAYWADLVKESGFDGVELIGLDRLDGMLPELGKRNLQLFTLYIKVEPEEEQPYDPRLKSYIKKLQHTGLHLWVHVHNKKYNLSDPAGDQKCVEAISELADFANNYGVKIAFYPHTDFWLEKVSDGLRLAKKINRPNVGTVFNLCHFLKADDPQTLEAKIEMAMPHLFLVSINGADEGDTNKMGWDRLIQPLGQGSYDVKNVLEILKNEGYQNPIGLQCYNIDGKPEVFLKQSMEAWEKYINQLDE